MKNEKNKQNKNKTSSGINKKEKEIVISKFDDNKKLKNKNYILKFLNNYLEEKEKIFYDFEVSKINPLNDIKLTNNESDKVCTYIMLKEEILLNVISMCPYIQIVINNKDSD